MMLQSVKKIFLVLTAFSCAVCEAALVGVLPHTTGGSDWQAYYDDDSNLTWYKYAFPTTEKPWADAMAWVAALNVEGVTGWRLPRVVQPDPACSEQNPTGDYGFNCTGSELSQMFYNILGGEQHKAITDVHNANFDLFPGLSNYYYWTETTWEEQTWQAWHTYFYDGNQNHTHKGNSLAIWPVYEGNAGAVPLPPVAWLFSCGLLGIIAAGRRARMA